MHSNMKPLIGKAVTVCGPVEPAALGTVMMHEHFYSDFYDYSKGELASEEVPLSPARRAFMFEKAVPAVRKLNDYGCHAFVDATFLPTRATPDFYYVEASRAMNLYIILCTGYYREIEDGTDYVLPSGKGIWQFVKDAAEEELTELCIREIAELTPVEAKAFRAGAKAQKATGVHITTHCTAEAGVATQLSLLDKEGVDLNRVAIGYIGWSLGWKEFRMECMEWMRRGASILATNLSITGNGLDANGKPQWQGLVEAIHEICDAGLGNRLGLGMDWGFGTHISMRDRATGKVADPLDIVPPQEKDGHFGPCVYVPPPPFVHLFSHTLPHFKKLGLSREEEDLVMRVMPQRIIPVQ